MKHSRLHSLSRALNLTLTLAPFTLAASLQGFETFVSPLFVQLERSLPRQIVFVVAKASKDVVRDVARFPVAAKVAELLI
ncbi:hypothetical protein ACSQ67_010384 [Phaseolus vulgaris]